MRATGRWLVAAIFCTNVAGCGVKGPLVPAPKAAPTPPAATAPVDKPAPEPTTPSATPPPERKP